MAGWRGWAVVLLAGVLAGCSGRSYVMLPGAGSVALGDEEPPRLTQAGQGMTLADGRLFSVSALRRERDFARALAAQPALPERHILQLQADGRLDAAAEVALQQVLEAVHRRDYPVVTVIGHTDTLGAEAANVRVGLRRAQAVAELLRARGLETMELRVTSHGERNLAVATPDATAEPRNRRVEVLIR
ncbi:outer membrane protein [Stutzerimonas stutzeri TS44]|nr:outer membrane protein [Stutzerimonas stutzeri TS44]